MRLDPSGRLDRLVTIEVRALTKGATGEQVESWSCLTTRWMSKRDVRAAERFAGQELRAEIDTVFRCRFPDPCDLVIAPDTHRLKYGGRVYQIHGCSEIGRREALELSCSARAEG